mmetsp:Transcript_126818/g.355139  ORF Transcript_126818/g.355139 Transcript_126818/m.355139 type:complete len:158 (+) Transcript_126818:3-476(+)
MAGASTETLVLVAAAVGAALIGFVFVVLYLSRLVRSTAEVDACPPPCRLAGDFLQAAAGGDAETCKQQLEVQPDFVDARNAMGQSALILAAKAGHTELCRDLIDARADVEATDLTGRTPLSYAAKARHYEVCRALLEAGADVESTDCVARDVSCALL